MVFSANVFAAKPILYDLTTEYQTNPLSIDMLAPRFSWKISSSDQGVMQNAYEIRVSDKPVIKNGNIWHSGKVATDASILIPYGGLPLESKKRYYWQVRVWDNKGNASDWSAVNFWEMGLLSTADWKASWIHHPQGSQSKSSPLFRKSFQTTKKIKSAKLYITSHGLYETYINGNRIGEFYFTPGWTSYHKRLQYQVYDVSQEIKSGNNQLSVMLGDGWYRGNLMSGNAFYGNDLALLAQLEITYQDGKIDLIKTDNSWKTSLDGAITMSDIYNGERYDARRMDKDWHHNQFNDQD